MLRDAERHLSIRRMTVIRGAGAAPRRLDLCPTALGEDQPHPKMADAGLSGGNRVADPFYAVVLVLNPAAKQFRAYLYDAVEFPNVERPLGAKPNLDITGRRGTKPGFLGACDGFRHHVRQQRCEMPKDGLGQRAVVGHVDQGHEPSWRTGQPGR